MQNYFKLLPFKALLVCLMLGNAMLFANTHEIQQQDVELEGIESPHALIGVLEINPSSEPEYYTESIIGIHGANDYMDMPDGTRGAGIYY